MFFFLPKQYWRREQSLGTSDVPKGVNMMIIFDDAEVISTYTLKQAIEDGALV
jgi:hypothetical protein